MIRLQKLHIQNIGPFSSQEFDFGVAPGDPDIHIFTGINGTGKTTILHGIAELIGPTSEYVSRRGNQFHKRFQYFGAVKDMDRSSWLNGILENTALGVQLGYVVSIQGNNLASQTNFGILNFHHEDWEGGPQNQFMQNMDNYRGKLAPDASGLNISFAAFGYSGYRLIESAPILLGNEHKFNPLFDALSFVKQFDPNFNVSNWIASRSASAAFEETNGSKEAAKRTRQAVDVLLKSISDLTDNAYTFAIETQPWSVGIKYNGRAVEFDVLPDGLRSVLSWMGDLLMRLDSIPWVDKSLPVNEQNFILLLDEVEVHLHPRWQYQILPLTRKIFPNAQIFLTTHSPFILNSIDGAKIYRLRNEDGEAKLEDVVRSETGNSYAYVYEHILETQNMFGHETTQLLKRFNELDKQIAHKDYSNEAEFRNVVARLIEDGEEVATLISSKLMRLKRITGKDYFHGENHEKAAV